MPIHLDVVSVERTVYSDEVDTVIAPGIEGEMAIKPRHASLMTGLNYGQLVIKKAGLPDEIIAIGTNASDLRTVSDILTASGTTGVTDALGPATAGVTRLLRLSNNGVTRDVTVTKADYDLSPLSPRYGAITLSSNGHQIGYLNLRTFITAADPQLKDAFQRFRAQGITEFIIDMRYNGGGLVDIADLVGDLLGGARSSNEVWERTTYRPEKASNNTTHRFVQRSQAVSPVKIAFIGTPSTASASEIVINGTLPYLGASVSLIGGNTYGKPVGQIAVDRAQCDDRLRVVAFGVANAAGNSGYYNGPYGYGRPYYGGYYGYRY